MTTFEKMMERVKSRFEKPTYCYDGFEEELEREIPLTDEVLSPSADPGDETKEESWMALIQEPTAF